jgi:hypothetical protein
MFNGDEWVSVEVEAEVGELISELLSVGWTVSTSHYDATLFGNWYIDVTRADRTIRLVKDRSQYMIEGSPTPEIKAAGLWKAFDSFEEFRRELIEWAKMGKPGA